MKHTFGILLQKHPLIDPSLRFHAKSFVWIFAAVKCGRNLLPAHLGTDHWASQCMREGDRESGREGKGRKKSFQRRMFGLVCEFSAYWRAPLRANRWTTQEGFFFIFCIQDRRMEKGKENRHCYFRSDNIPKLSLCMWHVWLGCS